jgi:hypothetical protein
VTQAESHPLKLPRATDEEIDNLTLYLGTLTGGTPITAENSLITQGYNLYIQAGCVACHLASAQGTQQGGIGQPIAGTDPDNIYGVLTGAVPCHPIQVAGVPLPPMPCSVTGSYSTGTPTTAMLVDTPPPNTDDERTELSYFLAFIAPPPAVGVEPCQDRPGEICTVVGIGVGGFTHDDVAATETLIYYPKDLALTDWNQDGTPDLAIDDWNNHRIRVVFIDKDTPKDDGSGVMVTNRIISIAGTGKVTGDDALNHPTDLAFDANGALVMANWHNQNIYRYPRGLLRGGDRDQLAGLCDLMCQSDAMGPTRVDQTFLSLPSSVAIHPDGRIFFAEQGCARIRILTIGATRTQTQPAGCITPVNLFVDGMIATLAGIVSPPMGVTYAGDGGPASAAVFNVFRGPTIPNFGIALSPENPPDELYVADSMNHVIRAIDLRANPPTISLFAGVPGMSGFADGPAESALFNFPANVYVDENHIVYVADQNNHAVRQIDQMGRVTTIAGTGAAGFNGDNIPATEAELNSPFGIAKDARGRIFIADTNNNRVRVINPPAIR